MVAIGDFKVTLLPLMEVSELFTGLIIADPSEIAQNLSTTNISLHGVGVVNKEIILIVLWLFSKELMSYVIGNRSAKIFHLYKKDFDC